MRNYKLARRYAKAHFGMSLEEKNLDTLRREMRWIQMLIWESKEFRVFIHNRSMPHEQTTRLLDKFFGGKMDKVTCRFLELLAEKEKLYLLPDICEIYEHMCRAETGVLKVIIRSVRPLTAEQIQRICSKLKNYYRKKIEPLTELDPALLAGFQVVVQDRIYDFSARAKLGHYRQSVMSV